MKTLLCTKCNHLFSLSTTWRTCDCRRVAGRYVDNSRIEVAGPAEVYGIQNTLVLGLDAKAFSYPTGNGKVIRLKSSVQESINRV